jgi:hypothetical protein
MRVVRATILLALMLRFGESAAQQLSEVVEKTVEKTINVKPSEILDINALKADVSISSADQQHVSIKIIFTASHPDKAVATKELEYQKYAIGRQGSSIIISNTYIIPEGVSTVVSRMTARIELIIPSSMDVTAIGEYTDFAISNTGGSNKFRMRFGKLVLKNITGPTKVNTHFGDVEADGVSGKLTIDATRSDIVLRVTDVSIERRVITNDREKTLNTGDIVIRNTSGEIKIEKSGL